MFLGYKSSQNTAATKNTTTAQVLGPPLSFARSPGPSMEFCTARSFNRARLAVPLPTRVPVCKQAPLSQMQVVTLVPLQGQGFHMIKPEWRQP